MSKLTLTLKLPFYRLNTCQAAEFECLTWLNTEGRTLLKVDTLGGRKYTSKDFHHVGIGSMWINQTIRNTCTQTKVKKFKPLPIEFNQGYNVTRQGDLFTEKLWVCASPWIGEKSGRGMLRKPSHIQSPLEKKKFFLFVNPIRFQGEVIINY